MISFEARIDTLCSCWMGTVAQLLYYLTACTEVLTSWVDFSFVSPGIAVLCSIDQVRAPKPLRARRTTTIYAEERQIKSN
jgi:hypothetical protein